MRRTGSASRSRAVAISSRRTVVGSRGSRGRRSTRPLPPTGPTPQPPGRRGSSPPRCTASTGPTATPTGGVAEATGRSGAPRTPSGVWDGFVPYVIGSPMAIPNMFTVRMHAQRILRNRLDQIVDAVEPGGSGDMFEDLDAEERDALSEVTRMGFPPRSWFGHRTMGMHAFPVLYRGLRAADPAYFEDFWAEPGYLGHAAPPSLRRDRVMEDFEVRAVITRDEASPAGGHPGQAHGGVDTAWHGGRNPAPATVAVRLSGAARVEVRGADLYVRSGAAAGGESVCCPSSTMSPSSAPEERPPSRRSGPATRSPSTTAAISPPRPTTGTRCPRATTSRSGINSGTRMVHRSIRSGRWCSGRCSLRPRRVRSNRVASRER